MSLAQAYKNALKTNLESTISFADKIKSFGGAWYILYFLVLFGFVFQILVTLVTSFVLALVIRKEASLTNKSSKDKK